MWYTLILSVINMYCNCMIKKTFLKSCRKMYSRKNPVKKVTGFKILRSGISAEQPYKKQIKTQEICNYVPPVLG